MNLLVEKSKKGDKESFVKLMKAYELSLYKVAKAMLRNDEDVADAMSDTILTCYEKIHLLKENGYFKTWMTKILINKCNDILRKNNKVIQLHDYYEESYTIDFVQSVSLKEGISNLSKEQQIVFYLYYELGFNSREISELLKEKESTIKVRLFRGKNKLREFFKVSKEEV